jgi:hypothetical protein
MSENLHFDFEGTRMCLDVPHDIMQTSLAKSRSFSRILNLTDPKYRVIDYTVGDGSTRLLFKTRKIGHSLEEIKESKCGQILSVVNTALTFARDDRQDPNLEMTIGLNPIGRGDRYGFDALVKWPEKNEAEVASSTTQAMRRTARDLRYVEPSTSLDDMVYARLRRRSGVTLETNEIASSSLDTDGQSYDPHNPTIDLSAHNLYSHQMQMICLSGLIAIARS